MGTGTFTVTRDTAPPTFTLSPAMENGALRVTWSISDAASGVDASACTLVVREDEGAWQPFSTDCAGDEIHSAAQPGHVYTFRLSATDNVSNTATAEALARFPRVTKYYYHGGQRVAQRRDGVVYYLHGDHLGSTSLVTSQTSEVVSRQLYHPYGTVRAHQGTLPTDFGFTGQRGVPGTGLVFMHARYYHTGLGRFTQADTVVPEAGNPQALNRYSYVIGNPLLYVDPTGHIFGLPPRPRVSIDISGWDPQVVQALDVVQETARIAAKVPVIAGPYAAAKAFLRYASVDSEEGTLVIGNREPWSATEVALQIAGLTAVIGAPSSLGPLRPPARPLLRNEGVLLTEAQGLQTRTAGLFDDVVSGTHGDAATKYLWTIDDRGINTALEQIPFDTPRGNIVHSNLSSEAYFAGEAWFTSPTEVVINAGSGRWGDRSGVTQAMWEAATQLWENLGYTVEALPLGTR